MRDIAGADLYRRDNGLAVDCSIHDGCQRLACIDFRRGAQVLREIIDGSAEHRLARDRHHAFVARGFETGYWAGHGIGLGLLEQPTLEGGDTRPLVAGMAVALHPNAVGKDGRGSLLSRTYLVGEQGPEPLSSFPLEWVRV